MYFTEIVLLVAVVGILNKQRRNERKTHSPFCLCFLILVPLSPFSPYLVVPEERLRIPREQSLAGSSPAPGNAVHDQKALSGTCLMRFRLSSPTRSIGVLLIFLVFLAQAGCATIQVSPSLDPGTGGSGSENPNDDVSGFANTGKIVGLAALAVAGGYLVYKAFIADPEGEEGGPQSDSSHMLPVGRPLISPDLSASWDE